MLREELACRDEIIVALQHVIRDLHHELENLRVENRYAVFASEARHTPMPGDEGGPSGESPEDLAETSLRPLG